MHLPTMQSLSEPASGATTSIRTCERCDTTLVLAYGRIGRSYTALLVCPSGCDDGWLRTDREVAS